jgi:hypothetical protein
MSMRPLWEFFALLGLALILGFILIPGFVAGQHNIIPIAPLPIAIFAAIRFIMQVEKELNK